MDIESFAKKIKESVENYNNSIETIGSLVKKYVDSNLENWQHFSGWNFYNNGEKIIITYSYEDFYSNTELYTEYDDMIVPLEEILKMDKKFIK